MNGSVRSISGWPAVAIALAAVILSLFVGLNVAYVASRGLCCADDAFFATVSKNLAWGYGYTATLDSAIRPFDPNITTGPTLVLPVSGAIRLFGNQVWVPGVVHIAIWTMLLFAAWWSLGAIGSRGRAAIVTAIFPPVAYAVSAYHLEQWYAMLGEVPAALAILVAVALWAVDPSSSRRALVAGLLCALAVLAKLLAALYVATFLGAAIAVALAGRHEPTRRGRATGLLLIGFVIPLLAFETWKFVSLGPDRYIAILQLVGEYVSRQGTSEKTLSLADIPTRLDHFSARFGIPLSAFVLLALLGGALAWPAGRSAFRRLYSVLLAGVCLHVGYWLLLSRDWPRYFFIGIVLLCALVAMPYLVLERPARIVLYSGALAFCLLGTVGRLQGPIASLGSTWFTPSATRASQASIVQFLDSRRDRLPFVSQWWAPVADIEYLSKGVQDFRDYKALTPAERARSMLVVTNARLDITDDKEQFHSFVAGCGQPVFSAPPYAVYECGGAGSTPSSRLSDPLPTQPGTPVVPTTAVPPGLDESRQATTGCNLEHIADHAAGLSPVVLPRGETLRLKGWIIDEREARVPLHPYVAFRRVALGPERTWYAGLTVGLPREDVARDRRHDAYRGAGFWVAVDTQPLPPGEYDLFLLFRDSGPPVSCDNGRRIILR